MKNFLIKIYQHLLYALFLLPRTHTRTESDTKQISKLKKKRIFQITCFLLEKASYIDAKSHGGRYSHHS